MKKAGQDVPIEVLNNIGVLHFEKEEFEVRSIVVLGICSMQWNLSDGTLF